MKSADELFKAGRLSDAIAAATGRVKSAPGDAVSRLFLAEMLVMAGDLERADKQLDAAMAQQAEMAVSIGLFRQLLRGEADRRRLFTDGPLPRFYSPDAQGDAKLRLEAIVCLRTGKSGEAKELVDQADRQRRPVRAAIGGREIDDLRDLDDCIGGNLEVLTANGTYYWLPWELLCSVEFRPPRRSRDLIWRSASLVLADGTTAEVYIPALYVPHPACVDESLLMGRSTDWLTLDGGVVRGAGQRMLLLGSDAQAILSIVEPIVVQPVEVAP